VHVLSLLGQVVGLLGMLLHLLLEVSSIATAAHTLIVASDSVAVHAANVVHRWLVMLLLLLLDLLLWLLLRRSIGLQSRLVFQHFCSLFSEAESWWWPVLLLGHLVEVVKGVVFEGSPLIPGMLGVMLSMVLLAVVVLPLPLSVMLLMVPVMVRIRLIVPSALSSVVIFIHT